MTTSAAGHNELRIMIITINKLGKRIGIGVRGEVGDRVGVCGEVNTGIRLSHDSRHLAVTTGHASPFFILIFFCVFFFFRSFVQKPSAAKSDHSEMAICVRAAGV